MKYNIRKLIKETIEKEFLCEVKIDIDDIKKRGFAKEVGNMYKNSLEVLNPISIIGKLGVNTNSGEASTFTIALQNGDVIQAHRNTNPAFGVVLINGEEFFVNSQELFSGKFPDIIKKYYSEYKTAKVGIPSK